MEENSKRSTDIKSNAEYEGKNLQIGNIISSTEQFIDRNKKVLVICTAVIVVLIAIFCLLKFWYMPSQETKAENELFAAEQYFIQQDYTKALKGDGKHLGLIAVSEDYSSTRHGKLAKFYIGVIYLEQGKYQEALDNFKGFKPKDVFMSSQTKALIGDCYWELNNLDKAIDNYKDAVETNPNNFTTPTVLMKLGAAYEVKKDFAKALDCYKQIKNDFPRSPEFSQIEKYISRMETLLNK